LFNEHYQNCKLTTITAGNSLLVERVTCLIRCTFQLLEELYLLKKRTMDVCCSFSLSYLHNLPKSTLNLISISLGRPLFNVPLSAVNYFATLKFPPQSNISCYIYCLSTNYVYIKLGCVSNDDECCFKIIICIVVCMTPVYYSPNVHTYCEAYHDYTLLKYVLLNKST